MILADILSSPLSGIFFLISIVMAVTVHEFSHAKVADILGDPTPAALGRVTLNPKAHLDLMGSLLFLLIGFGWGKPVPFDAYNLQNPKRDTALIALAGPASNIVVALLCSLMLYSINLFDHTTATVIGYAFLSTLASINIVLAVFNFMPFAPLDGFKIVGGLLSDEQAAQWRGLERYGIFFLMLFILPFAGGRSMLDIFMSPIIQALRNVLIP